VRGTQVAGRKAQGALRTTRCGPRPAAGLEGGPARQSRSLPAGAQSAKAGSAKAAGLPAGAQSAKAGSAKAGKLAG